MVERGCVMRSAVPAIDFALQYESKSGVAAIGWPRLLTLRELSAVAFTRYFVVVGSALAVLLSIAGWFLPEPPASFPDRPEIIERAAIRIRSERKWPEKIVLDTSKPAMTSQMAMDPPATQLPVPLPFDEATGRSNLEAMALLGPDAPTAAVDHPTPQIKHSGARMGRSRRVDGGSFTHRLARADTGRSCRQRSGRLEFHAVMAFQ